MKVTFKATEPVIVRPEFQPVSLFNIQSLISMLFLIPHAAPICLKNKKPCT